MKKLIIKLIRKYFDKITEDWTNRIEPPVEDKLTEAQLRTFVENTLNVIIEIIETGNYTTADQYLIDIYHLFTKVKLNLLQISTMFHQGRYSVLNSIEMEATAKYDPTILLGFLDDLMEQVYARYGMLHQEAQMKELTTDRDRLANKLEINQMYLKNILHMSDSAIMVVDDKEQFIAWNKGAEKIFGYTEEEVRGKTSSLLMPEDNKYIEELNIIKEKVKRDGYLKIDETERKTKDNRIISVELNVTQLPSKDGNYTGRSVFIKDVSEVKSLKQQVDQSEKLAVIGQLAAGIAHEIGNPLASISSVVQILQRKSKDQFFKEQLFTVKENIDRITKIVRELVDFSRPPGYEESLIDITDVVKTAIGIVKYDKRVKKVDFETSYAQDLPEIKIVPDQILQVFVNILLNALDAIEGTGKISVNVFKKDKNVLIEIIDDGCGIEKHVLDKIFDPFFTTKDVGRGTGLGLSVSYGIVNKFGGDIRVKSTPGKGSKFIVKLPLSV